TGEIVVVHDGVRPFVTSELIVTTIDDAIVYGAAMLGLPSAVQVKLVNDDGYVTESLDRQRTWLGQTPQAFRRELLAAAYEAAIAAGYDKVSDDADIVAAFTNVRPRILLGAVSNIKITTP